MIKMIFGDRILRTMIFGGQGRVPRTRTQDAFLLLFHGYGLFGQMAAINGGRRGGQMPPPSWRAISLTRKVVRYGWRKGVSAVFTTVRCAFLIPWFTLTGPPRVLRFSPGVNAAILRAFGANVGRRFVRIFSPIILHHAANGYRHLSIGNDCVLNGNNFLDLTGRITLEEGVSLGPGVIIMTHNGFNCNSFLQKELARMCGVKDVLIRRGAGIKANALVTMGVTIGEDAVVAGSAVVNRSVGPRHFVAGVPARVVSAIGTQADAPAAHDGGAHQGQLPAHGEEPTSGEEHEMQVPAHS